MGDAPDIPHTSPAVGLGAHRGAISYVYCPADRGGTSLLVVLGKQSAVWASNDAKHAPTSGRR